MVLLNKDHHRRPHVTFDGATASFIGTTVVRLQSGTYTGDGATSLAVTGVGFKPILLIISARQTSDSAGAWVGFTTDNIMDDNAAGGSISLESVWAGAGQFRTNEIISLDTDGFTVDDDGADAHPNKNSQVYNYIALG